MADSITLRIFFMVAATVVVALFPLALPKAAVWPVFVLAIIAAVISGFLIINNEQRLRRRGNDKTIAVDSEKLAYLKELSHIFLQLDEGQESLVQEAMKANWKDYVKYFKNTRIVKENIKKYSNKKYSKDAKVSPLLRCATTY
jgi:hypothetical protein